MSLYLTIELLVIIIPLSLSFDRKVGYYKIWPALFPAVLITSIFFIFIDIYFTRKGVWGFNPEYHSGIVIAGLPVEEWLFFVFVPFSSIFIHFVMSAYFPNAVLSDRSTRIISTVLVTLLLVLIILYHTRLYPLFYLSLMAIVIVISLFDKSGIINRLYITYLIILIPFFIVNGILTGTFIDDEVVWYNEAEIIGIRILTVPVEDIAYGFSLILINLLLLNNFKKNLKIRYPI